MPNCLVPNCENNGNHNLGIRLRRPETSAIWAPNCDAFLCDEHADQGYTVDLVLTPKEDNDRTITSNVSVNGGNVVSRTTNIVHHP